MKWFENWKLMPKNSERASPTWLQTRNIWDATKNSSRVSDKNHNYSGSSWLFWILWERSRIESKIRGWPNCRPKKLLPPASGTQNEWGAGYRDLLGSIIKLENSKIVPSWGYSHMAKSWCLFSSPIQARGQQRSFGHQWTAWELCMLCWQNKSHGINLNDQ